MRRFRNIALALLLSFAFVRPAAADSFMNSVPMGSKTAARVRTARQGLNVIKQTRNVAIGFDVLRRLDAAPNQDMQFRSGLAKLARSGDPVFRLLRGVNMVANNRTSKRGIAHVRQAAKKMPYDSAAQLVAGLAVAQRDAFGLQRDFDKKTPLKKEAAKLINRARSLEKGAAHPRPLVAEGLRQATTAPQGYGAGNVGYVGLYKGYKGLLRRK